MAFPASFYRSSMREGFPMSIVAWFRVSSDGSPWVDQRRKHPWNTYARCHVRPRHSSRLAFLPLHSLRWWKRGQLIGVPVPDRSCQGLVGAPHPPIHSDAAGAGALLGRAIQAADGAGIPSAAHGFAILQGLPKSLQAWI